MASLSPGIATEVCDLILAPPTDTPYDKLKEELIKRTSASEQKRLQQLLNAEELGPSQVLPHMQQLLGDKANAINKSFLCELFLQQLPANIRMVVASTPDTTGLEDLAQLADKIMEVATPAIAAVHMPPIASEVEQLCTKVAYLKDVVTSLSKSWSSSTRTARGCSPSPHCRAEPTLCWYHKRFGDAARKCQSPSKSGNDPASR